MNFDLFVKQSLEEAAKVTGKSINDSETQEIAFKLACAAMAQEKAQ